jgi:uncharacterized protein DUF397
METNTALNWHKSSHSGSNGGQCIEVAASGPVLVRDSKNPDGGRLTFSTQAWREFAARIKTGNAS